MKSPVYGTGTAEPAAPVKQTFIIRIPVDVAEAFKLKEGEALDVDFFATVEELAETYGSGHPNLIVITR